MTTAAHLLAPTGGATLVAFGQEQERWLQFLGVEAPPLSALPIDDSLGDPATLPLMSKDVAAAINMDIVALLIRDPTALGPEF